MVGGDLIQKYGARGGFIGGLGFRLDVSKIVAV
jgi:hypothetical protein